MAILRGAIGTMEKIIQTADIKFWRRCTGKGSPHSHWWYCRSVNQCGESSKEMKLSDDSLVALSFSLKEKVDIYYMHVASGGQKRMSDALELKLQQF